MFSSKNLWTLGLRGKSRQKTKAKGLFFKIIPQIYPFVYFSEGEKKQSDESQKKVSDEKKST